MNSKLFCLYPTQNIEIIELYRQNGMYITLDIINAVMNDMIKKNNWNDRFESSDNNNYDEELYTHFTQENITVIKYLITNQYLSSCSVL